MSAVTIVQTKPKKMSRKTAVKMWFILALVAVAAIGMMAPELALAQEPASCVNGLDANGDPCLDLKVDVLMGNIFKWANMIIPVILPLVAIGIGIQFGGNILSSIKNFFGSFKLG